LQKDEDRKTLELARPRSWMTLAKPLQCYGGDGGGRGTGGEKVKCEEVDRDNFSISFFSRGSREMEQE
jgi:hypothetical protein